MAPSVSVIMAVHNGERFLAEAIGSVLAQTHTEFEFIIVDDGSTDRTPEILARYAAADPRIVVLTQAKRGLPASLNRAIARSRCQLLARMDADDRMLPNRLERQLAFMAGRSVSVACTHCYLIDASGKRVGKSETQVDVDAGVRSMNLKLFMEMVHPSVIMRKHDVVAVGGYDESFRYCEDRDLWGRLITAGKRIECQPELLLEFRLHSGAMTMQKALQTDLAVRLIDLNIIRRLRGLPNLSLTEFARLRRQRPLWKKIDEERRLAALLHFKSAVRYYGERKVFPFVASLAVALLLQPISVARRVAAKVT